jgi:hypothetical protein
VRAPGRKRIGTLCGDELAGSTGLFDQLVARKVHWSVRRTREGSDMAPE